MKNKFLEITQMCKQVTFFYNNLFGYIRNKRILLRAHHSQSHFTIQRNQRMQHNANADIQ